MYQRRSVNVFCKESVKLENEPEQLFSKFPKPINQIDQYIQKEDRSYLAAKRKFRKSMRHSSHFTHTRSYRGSVLSELEAKAVGRAIKRRAPGDFYLTGMPIELMSVNLKSKKTKKRKINKLKRTTKAGEDEASSEEEKGKKKASDSESEQEIYSNSSGEEAGDYADTYFDNGEDYLPSDKSGGEEDFY